jgi:hypothetical protein
MPLPLPQLTKTATTPKRWGALILGSSVFLLCAFHLIAGDAEGGWSSHDIIVGVFGTLAAGIAFPDSVIALVSAWRQKGHANTGT